MGCFEVRNCRFDVFNWRSYIANDDSLRHCHDGTWIFLASSNFTCRKNVRCSTCIFITQEIGRLGSKFPSLKIAWRRQSVTSWWYAKWRKVYRITSSDFHEQLWAIKLRHLAHLPWTFNCTALEIAYVSSISLWWLEINVMHSLNDLFDGTLKLLIYPSPLRLCWWCQL